MPVAEVKFKDKDGFHYRYPARSCSKCTNYPCLPSMNKLFSNFAAYGCEMFKDDNVFDTWKPKK